MRAVSRPNRNEPALRWIEDGRGMIEIDGPPAGCSTCPVGPHAAHTTRTAMVRRMDGSYARGRRVPQARHQGHRSEVTKPTPRCSRLSWNVTSTPYEVVP